MDLGNHTTLAIAVKEISRDSVCGYVSRGVQEGQADDDPSEAALAGIRRVVAGVIRDMQANAETPPKALSSKRFSGKFMLRIPPELHRKLAIEAQEEGISLNRLASDKLSRQDA